MNKANSPLTSQEVETAREGLTDTTFYYDPGCGNYAVTRDILRGFSRQELDKMAMVLASKSLRSVKTDIHLTEHAPADWSGWTPVSPQQILAEYPSDAASIFDAALLNLSRTVQFPSESIEITDINRWRIFAHDRNSALYILRQLKEMSYISSITFSEQGQPNISRVTIEANGWLRIQTLQSNEVASDQAFVAMWFDEQMDEYFTKGIQPAITDTGFRCIKIDLTEHNNKICDEIIANIRRSKFLVADFSGNRGGVYYEAGFAHGLGRPVVWTVRQDHLKDVHFDTRQYNHIVYSTPDELRNKLNARIRATII